MAPCEAFCLAFVAFFVATPSAEAVMTRFGNSCRVPHNRDHYAIPLLSTSFYGTY